MFLDGVEGDHELAGDGLIRPARRQHFQDLELAAGGERGRGLGVALVLGDKGSSASSGTGTAA